MKSLDKLLNYLLIFLVVAIAGSFFYFKKGPSVAAPVKNQSLDVDKVVNKYLQEANYAKSLEQVKLQKAAFEALQKIQNDQETRRLQEEEKSVVSAKIPSHQETLIRAEKLEGDPNLPSKSLASTDSDDSLDFKTMSKEDKEEYKKQFIQSAKAGGYLIELNDKMEVIKSTPIRQPSQQNDSVETAPTD